MNIEERARQAAESARFRLGAKPGRVDVFDAIRSFAIRLLRYPVSDNALEGAYLRSRGMAYILVNSAARPVRQRFTAAHELGHHFLHPNVELEHYDARLDEPADRAANRFAAYFLMDESTVRKVAAEETDPVRRALVVRYRFEVSLEAAAIHLCHLGVIDERTKAEVLARRDSAASLPALAREVGLVVPREQPASNVVDAGPEYARALAEIRDAGFLSDDRYATMLSPFSRQRRPAAASSAQ